MQKLLSFFIIILMFSCSQLLYDKYGAKYQGEKISYYDNGKIKEKSNYKNGQLDGEKIIYDKYSKIKLISNYKNGNIEWKANFKNGKREGEANILL